MYVSEFSPFKNRKKEIHRQSVTTHDSVSDESYVIGSEQNPNSF